jgi:N-acetylglucosaminyldiphosphoundecaprenol N-acetyl-beta-D-mannosaminyltransferase
VAAAAGRVLEARYPGLRIAGTAAPFVRTAGPELANAAEADAALLAQIHASGADILLVGLGNPKQELWFNRNRGQLRTPVSIGVGGSFEFVTGSVRRAPALWRRLNLEWVYRITQDPRGCGNATPRASCKLAVLAAPVFGSRLRESLVPGTRPAAPPARLPWRRLWSSRQQSIALLPLPRSLGRDYLERVVADLAGDLPAQGLRILDFSGVRHIALDAQQEFFNLAGLLRSQRGSLQLMGLSRRVRQQLGTARLLDLLEGTAGSALEHLSGRGVAESAFGCASYALGDATLVMLSGRVTGDALRDMGFVECMLHSARDRHCILDFRSVDLLESSGIAELLPLLTKPAADHARVMLSGVGYSIRQMLRMAEISSSAACIDDRQLLAHIRAENGHD